MHSCKDTDKDKNNTCNSRPENRLANALQVFWNNGMNNEQQTANDKGYASVNPKGEYICQNISQNNKDKRKNHLCVISQFRTITLHCQIQAWLTVYATSFSNSSTETPNRFANEKRLDVLGSEIPCSHFDTDCLLTPTASATNSCVILFLVRWLFKTPPKDFLMIADSLRVSEE